MRRLLVLLLLPALLLTACGGGKDDGGGSSGASDLSGIKVSGQSGKEPKVSGVKGVSTKKIETRTVSEGDGAKLSDGQTINMSYALYKGSSGKPVASTYKQGSTVPVTLNEAKDKLLSGAIVGHKVGSRMLIAGPAKNFFGPQGNPQAGVKADDTLVLVAELISKFQPPKATGSISDVDVTGAWGKKPTVKAEKGLVVDKTESKVLKKGDGPAVKKGDKVQVRYVGVDGTTGKEFDSSYKRGKPASFTLDPGQVIPGFVTGLSGKKIGSRVLVTIPYTDGYGAAGNPQAGIKGGDSLVFVIDLVKKG
ncbi:MAG: FKBP-type peptidyl-prolyl cis-trans isomerase [Nocardioidaceae bacterium]